MNSIFYRGDANKVEQWCRENTQGEWRVSNTLGDDKGGWAVLDFANDEDYALFKMFDSNCIVPVGKIQEPALSLDELNSTPVVEQMRSYIITEWNGNENFIEEVIAWCDENLTSSYLKDRLTIGSKSVIVGFSNQDDCTLFMLRWESHQGIKTLRKWDWIIE